MAKMKRMLRSYRFMDKDPIKDEMQTALEEAGFYDKNREKCRALLRKLAILANVSYQTLDALFFGDTKRPQNATVEGTLRAAGLERVIRKVRTIKDLDAELKEAREFARKEDQRVAKANARPARKRKRPARAKKGKPNLRVVGGRAA